MDCNDTKTFLTESQRMCQTCACTDDCPFTGLLNSCYRMVHKDPELSIGIVQRWSDKHPATDEQQVTA